MSEVRAAVRETPRPHRPGTRLSNPLRSVFFRTYLGIGVLSLGALVATSAMLDRLFVAAFDERAQRELGFHARVLQRSLARLEPRQWSRTVAAEDCHATCSAKLLDPDGVRERHPHLDMASDESTWVSAGDDPEWWRLERVADTDRFLYLVQQDMDALDIDPLFYWADAWLPLGSIFLVMALGMVFLARGVSRPVAALATVAEAVGRGDLGRRASTGVPAPLNVLASSLNVMSANLQRKISEQQVLIGAVPHELRTPLARIRFAVDVAQGTPSEAGLRRQVELIDRYVGDLESTVADVIAITRLARVDPVRTERFDLEAVLLELRSEASRQGVDVSVRAADVAAVDGDPALLGRALRNVLENAVRHATDEVRVRAERVGDRVRVRVDDDGPGIPSGRREEAFMPFSRLDESRARDGGGAGLGLALVRLTMERHDGEASIGRADIGGARVTLAWPG